MHNNYYEPFTYYFIEHKSDYKIIKKGKCNILSNYEMNLIYKTNEYKLFKIFVIFHCVILFYNTKQINC